MKPFRATYRLQMRSGFTLDDARKLAPYLTRLGVSHLYLSPILEARAGSTHGYDVLDPRRVDPALGGDAAFERLARALRRAGLGILLDVVPNHMTAHPSNPFLADVLRHGPASRFDSWFDVDWGSGKRPVPLILPVLGDRLERLLERGELQLERGPAGFAARYYENVFPLDPATLDGLLAEAATRLGMERPRDAAVPQLAELARRLRALPPRSARHRDRAERAEALEAELAALLGRSRAARAALDGVIGEADPEQIGRLLRAQAYRLAFWRHGRHALNYRRFFDINDLVAVRVEDPAVFGPRHARILELVRGGVVDGLRIDHIDGLWDPRGYLEQLDRAARAALPARARAGFLLLVEKILEHGEALRRDWAADGTTGYEFVNQIEAALIDPRGAAELRADWSRRTGLPEDFGATARTAKRRVLRRLLRADVGRLARELDAILAAQDPSPRPRLAELGTAITEVVVALPVYRTYVDARGRLEPAERRMLQAALDAARAAGVADPAALDPLGRVLLLEERDAAGADGRARRIDFVRRFQQLSGPAAAKGVEDTAFYVHVPLLSRCEVGGDPGTPLDDAVPTLHQRNAERARHWPRTLLAATTHDTKRNADVRARLDVLSEVPAAWRAALGRWRRWNQALRRPASGRSAPDANTEYLLYQNLLGIWPLPEPDRAPEAPPRAAVLRELRERLTAYLEKATREAKQRTSWIDPDSAFEEAVREFTRALLDPRASRPFLEDFSRFAAGIARPGLWNALSRTLFQLTSPGLPDLYQGDELWSFALVDPDNRRPVDFGLRKRLLGALERRFDGPSARRLALVEELVQRPEDGRVKLHLVRRALEARRRHLALFAEGDYTPLHARGSRAAHLLGFVRQARGGAALVLAPRLPLGLTGDAGRAPVGPEVWGDTRLVVPRALAGRVAVSALTARRMRLPASTDSAGLLPVATALSHFPVELWIVAPQPARIRESSG